MHFNVKMEQSSGHYIKAMSKLSRRKLSIIRKETIPVTLV